MGLIKWFKSFISSEDLPINIEEVESALQYHFNDPSYLFKSLKQNRYIKAVISGVNFLDLALGVRAIVFFDDSLHVPIVITNDTPIPSRLIKHRRRKRNRAPCSDHAHSRWHPRHRNLHNRTRRM